MSDRLMINNIPARTSHVSIMLFLAMSLMAALLNSSAPTPLYPFYQHELGLTAVSLTLIYGAYAAGVLISLLGVGSMANHARDLRYTLVPALITVFCGALMFARAESFTLLVIARLLAGIGTGALTGAANIALVRFGPKDSGRVAALVATLAFTTGLALGPIFSGIALQTEFHPTTLPFILIMAITVIAVSGIITTWPSSTVSMQHETNTAQLEQHPRRLRSDLRSIAKNFFMCAVALFTCWAVAASILAIGPAVSESLLGIHSRGIYGYVIAAYLAIAGLSQILSRKVNAQRGLKYGCLSQALSVMLFAAAANLHSITLASVAMVIGGYAYGAIFVGSATLVNKISPKASHARLLSLFYILAYVANWVPVLLGVVIDHGSLLRAINLLFIISAVICLLLSMMISRAQFSHP